MSSKPSEEVAQVWQVLCAEIDSAQVKVLSAEDEELITSHILERFPRSFPYKGASLYWPYPDAAPLSSDEELVRIKQFLEEVMRITGLASSDEVCVIWDDAAQQIVCLPSDVLLNNTRNLVRHTHIYIVPPDVSWAACLDSFGDLGFGFAPPG